MNKKPEYIVLNLFTILFLISLIKTKVLLGAIAFIVIIYGILTTRNIKFFKTIKGILPFIILMFIPYIGEYILGRGFFIPDYMRMIMYRVILSAIILGIINQKYSQLILVDGIVDLGINPILSRIIALTFRYFYMINSDVKIGKKALEARGILNNSSIKNLSIWGEWMGGFFLKSNQHGEQVHNAMIARGFTGESRKGFFQRKDLVTRLTVLVIFTIIILAIERRFLIGS